MSDECNAEEVQLFSEIKTNMESLETLIHGEDYQQACRRFYHVNLNLEVVLDHYSLNHDCTNPSMTINLDHCLLIRNILLYNVLWIIGPKIYPTESDVRWDMFSSSLPMSGECLRSGYLHFREYVDEDMLKRVVIISLRVGTIEDYEIAGIAYSLSYFIQYLLTIEEEGNGDSYLVTYFYDHMSDYSFVLLVTSVLSLQRETHNSNLALNHQLNRLMGRITMMKGGVQGVIATLLSYVDGGDIVAITKVARGVASCPSGLDHDKYMNSISSQICALIEDRSSNQFVVTACVHIIDILVRKDPIVVYKHIYTRLFGPLFQLVHQPFYSNLRFQPDSHRSIEESVQSLTRILQSSTTLLSIIRSLNVFIPVLFHLFVFVHSVKHALVQHLNKIIKLFIRSSPLAIHSFLLIIQGEGLESLPLRFALNSEGEVIVRSVESEEDHEWTLVLSERENWVKEAEAIVSLWVINGETRWLSDLFIELLDYFFQFKMSSNVQMMEQRQTRVAIVLLQILASNETDLFGDNLLKGLRSIRHVLLTIESQFQPDSAIPLSEESMMELISLCQDLLQAILLTDHIAIPKVVEMDRVSSRRHHSAHQIEKEEELAYKRSLLVESNLLQSDITRLVTDTEGMRSIHMVVLTIQSITDKLSQKLSIGLTDAAAEQEVEPKREWKSEDVTRLVQSLTRELRNPLEPLRSYALSRLERVIRDCDENTLKAVLPEIVDILKKALNDEDSYVYLAAVNGLTVVASRCGNDVLPVLLTVFSNQLAPLDLRLKICEAIVSIIHMMGRTSVKYTPMLMNAFLGYMAPSSQLTWKTVEEKKEHKATAEDEVFSIQALRAACFSSVAEIVSQIKYSMEIYLPELLSHCRGVLLFEKEKDAIIVRRAAVYLIYAILVGADEALNIILDKQMNTLQHILLQATDDKDDIVKGHANACLSLLSSRHPIIQELSSVCN